MKPIESLIGRKFGRLTVMEYDHSGRKGVHYLCKCDCGKTTIVAASNLKSGNTTSCGCKKYERRSRDLTGERFGQLYVVSFDHTDQYGTSYWLCKCECGNERAIARNHLLDGRTTSCGCGAAKAHVTHGMSYTSLYHTWATMRQRCKNVRHSSYKWYGGREVSVCDEWEFFENFKDWAMDNGYMPGLTIDRIDSSKDYSPDNCRWVDQITQANNKSNNHRIEYGGVTHTLAEWARLFNVKYTTLFSRVSKNDMHDFEEYFKEE